MHPHLPSATAQRRPGHQPRRHRGQALKTKRQRTFDYRSTKAGTSAPATHFSQHAILAFWAASALNEGRDISPGDTRLSSGASGRFDDATLNEGRDISPGDTPAGRYERARPVMCHARAAQRRPGHQPRRHVRDFKIAIELPLILLRSTKAGTSAPATRSPRRGCGYTNRGSPLNEGRDISPGDTSGSDARPGR